MEMNPRSVAETARQRSEKARTKRAIPNAPIKEFGESFISVSSSKLKNHFGEVVTQVISGQPVFITNRDQPAKVVLISTEKYNALVSREKKALERLTSEFDALLDVMQMETSKSAVDSLFEASGEELGRAAVDEAKRTE